jgi:type II secretion system protein L
LKGVSIEGQAHAELDSAAEEENPWVSAISSIREKLDTRGAVCLLSFPPSLASYRNVTIPFKDARKIRQVLPFEVEPLLPFPLDEMVLDFQMVRQTEGSDLIAAAVEKAKLQPVLDALAAFRLNPQLILPGGFPVAICLARWMEAEQFLYIDFDASGTTIFAAAQGTIHLVRSVYLGEASETVRMQTLTTQVKRLLVAFETLYEFDLSPERLFFSGPGLSAERVEEAVGRFLEIPAEPVNLAAQPGARVQSAPDGVDGESANNPLALAFIDWQNIACLNFFQQRNALYRYWEAYRSSIVRTAAAAGVVLAVGMAGVVHETGHLKARVNRMDQQMTEVFTSTFPDASRIVDPLEQMRIRVREAKGRDRFAGIREDGARNIDILNDLSRLVPPGTDVILTRFVRGEGSVLISGHTDTFNAVDDIKGALARSRFFKEITISSANMDKASNRVQFKLKLELPAAGPESG